MIVIPEVGRFLVVGIMVVLCREEPARLGPVRREPSLRIPVAVRPDVRPVEVNYRANARLPHIRTVDRRIVGIVEKVSVGEIVHPPHADRSAGSSLQGGTRPCPVIAPEG